MSFFSCVSFSFSFSTHLPLIFSYPHLQTQLTPSAPNSSLVSHVLLEDDDFIIDEENIIEKLGKELASLIKEVAEYNEGISLIDIVRDSYSKKFKMKTDSWLFILKSNDIAGMLEEKRNEIINMLLDIIEEIFTNQELYEYIKKEIPVIEEIVDKLNAEDSIVSLNDIIEWFDEEFSNIKVNGLEDIKIYEYLAMNFSDFNNIFVTEETKPIVKN